jgi:hypothetical protein
MVGSDQVPPERLQRALVEAAVEEFRDRTTTIRFSPPRPTCCSPRLGEKNQKRKQPRNEAQLHFVPSPMPKGICCPFGLDSADAFIDGRLSP